MSEECAKEEKPTCEDAQEKRLSAESDGEDDSKLDTVITSGSQSEVKAIDDGCDNDAPPEKPAVQKGYELDKAPPPIKIRRDNPHVNSPPDLSPPPSPKRMRELERKEGVFSVIVPSKELQQQNL